MPQPDPKRQVRRFRLAIALLTFATAVFRSELAILLCAVTLHGVLTRAVPWDRVVSPFAFSFALSLLFSVPVDSYFWQRYRPLPLWPELAAFYYNAVLGSSSDWGVSPWHWYFTSALPRILANPLATVLLVPLALAHLGTAPRARRIALPALLFVAIYSLQPHKEARFVFYAAPPLTAAAAIAADFLFRRRAKSLVARLTAVAVTASVPLSLAISSAMLLASALNYPGGEALRELRALIGASSPLSQSPDLPAVVVHTDVLSCMTGVTLFGQHTDLDSVGLGGSHSGGSSVEKAGDATTTTVRLVFDKTEDPAMLRDPGFWDRFDYALAADPAAVLGPYEIVGVVEGFAGLEIAKPPPRDHHHTASSAEIDVESGSDPVLGRGALISRLKDRVTRLTGGWWVGPRMAPRVHILRRMRGGEARRAVAE